MSYPSLHHTALGGALMVILPILGLLLLLIVALLSIVSSESRQAAGTLERHQAEVFAQVALNEIADKLDKIPLDQHWAAAPGRIRYWNGTNWDNTIELHSGNAANADDPDQQVNLNGPLVDGSAFILPANAEYTAAPVMKLDWRYLLEDGSVISAPLPTGSKPVARFAYWVDLENARVNINTAGFAMTRFDYHLANTPVDTVVEEYPQKVWGSNPWLSDRFETTPSGPNAPPLDRSAAHRFTPQNLTGHPSAIDLARLDGVSVEESFNTFRYAGSYFLRADALNATADHQGWTPPENRPDLSVRFFSTPEDWQHIVTREQWLKNKAYITIRGRTPELTPWGIPKTALTFLANDGNALNDPTDTLWRNGLWPQNARHADIYSEDTRRVQIPVLQPLRGANATTLRSIITTNNTATIHGMMTTLRGILSTPVPGYAASLWEKYDAAPNGGEQFTLDLLAFADATLNGQSPGLPFFTPFHDLTGHSNYQRAGSLPSLDETRMLSPSVAPFFFNEFVLQAEPIAYTSTQIQNLRALRKGTGIESVNTRATNNPKPKAILTGPHSSAGITTLLYLLRDLQSEDERYLRIQLHSETIAAPHYGLAQTSLKTFGVRYIVYATNSTLQWTSDDPLSPTGTVQLDLSNQALGSEAPSAGYSVDSIYRQNVFSINGQPPASRPLGFSYAQTALNQNASIIIGPFRPGTLISTLRIKLRITASSAPRHGGGINDYTRYFQSFPGTGEKRSPESTGFLAAIEDSLVEFEFKDIDTASPQARFASIEAIDPRTTKTKQQWHHNADDDHTLGGDNSAYLEEKTATEFDDSDFSRPSMLLQAIRGRLRWEHIQADLPGHKIERQSASLILGLPGVGHLSGIPIRNDSNTPFATLKFHKNADPVPDWLLWSLFYVPYDRSIANQTDGKLNINATLYPFGIQRTRPLHALLADRVPNPGALANAIAAGPSAPPPGLPSDLFVYQGQICDVPGFADTGNEYEKETLPRDLADLITTQCDDYRAFILVERLRRTPNGKLIPTATRRFEATLSRTPDAGPSGYAFSDLDAPTPKAFPVYLRREYEAQGPSAPKHNVHDAAIRNSHRSALGADRLPNTADDWIIPQRIDVTRYRIVK